MLHIDSKFFERLREAGRWFAIFLLACLAGGVAQAQTLSLTPGQVKAVTDTTGLNNVSPTYSGLPSGLDINSGQGLTFDSQGDLFIVDAGANVVRVIAGPSGTPIPSLPSVPNPKPGYVYTVAGSGTSTPSPIKLCSTDMQSLPSQGGDNNYYGNGCPATDAVLSFLVSGDTFSGPAGIYQYFAPLGTVALDAHGNLYIADANDAQVRVVYAGGTIPFPATNTTPTVLTPGNIYAFSGGATQYIYGSYQPDGVAIDPSGNVFITELGFAGQGYDPGGVVYMVYGGGTFPQGLQNYNGYTTTSPVAGQIYAVAAYDSNTGDYGPWRFPGAISSDPNGNIYVNDTNNGTHQVYLFYQGGSVPGLSLTSSDAGTAYPFTGGGNTTPQYAPNSVLASNASMRSPSQLSFDSAGDLYVGDFVNYFFTTGYIDKVDASGNLTLVAGSAVDPNTNSQTNCAASVDSYGDGCPANQVAIYGPLGLALGANGDIYYSDRNVLHKIDVTTSGLQFTASAGASAPTQVASVSNAGTQALKLSAIDATGPFSQVSSGGTDCTAATALAPGQSCELGIAFNPSPAGSYTGTITIASNSTNATGGNNTITLAGTANQVSDATALSISPTLANVGQPVTLTAAISAPSAGSIPPGGTVTFLNGANSLGTAQVSNNVATLNVSTLPAGTYNLTASYGGDSNYQSSVSYPVTLVVSSKPVPVVALTASASGSTQGQSVTFTATVSPYSGTTTQPTGSVTFTDGQNALSSAVTLSGGVASFSTSTLPVGANTIYAVYSGDSNFTANTSATGVAVQVQGNALLVLQPGVISTVAGTLGVYGYSGDGGPAIGNGADLGYHPSAVSVDPSGNMYIADAGNFRVRMVAAVNGTFFGQSMTAGDIYTVAGNGNGCTNNSGILSCGDGGPATSANLINPQGAWADGFGNLYISDNESGGGLVRKVNSSGIISTVAGNLNTNNPPVNLGDGGAATNATLGGGVGIGNLRTDNRGNIYIADSGDNLIRRVDAETGIITTVAGSQFLGGGYSGDGGLATNAQLSAPGDVALDSTGNLFIADSSNKVVRRVDAQTGVITTVAGTPGTGGYTGDGGSATSATLSSPGGVFADPAGDLYISDSSNNVVRVVNAGTGVISTVVGTNATLSNPLGLTLDGNGNLYIADTYNEVAREVTGSNSAINFGSQNLGSTTGQTFTVSSSGGLPLSITAINFPGGFVQEPSGGTDCSAPMTLNPGQSCELNVSFFPTAATPFNGAVTIASNSSNATSGVNSIAVSGSGVANSGTTAQTITFTPPSTATYGDQIKLNASATSGLSVTILASGPAKLIGNTLTVTGVGHITLTAYQFGDSTYAAATQAQATITASAAPLTVTASSFSQAPGLPIPALTYTIAGLVNGDTQAAVTTGAPVLTTTATQASPTGQYPITITQGTLQTTTPNYTLASFVNGKFNITQGLSQTITFPAIPNANSLVYGAGAIQLTATTSAPGLQVVYTVQGNAKITGSILSITGAGPVAVYANQPGDATYQAAQQVAQSFVVAQAPLTFTANNQTMAQGSVVPQLTYSVGGLVNGDTAANVVSGTPALTTTATSSSLAGTSAPITISQGSVSVSTNYAISAFSFLPGTMTVVTGNSQTITFGAVPGVTYGAAPFTLGASASSNLPVTFSVSGPALLTNNLLTVTGAGTVTVTATQGGNAAYTAAPPVPQSFTIAQAPLTVTANNVTRLNDSPNPNFTYTITGFVNGETTGVISGAPVLTTTATPGSPAGTYPINVATGSLAAANYAFANFVTGTLTITTGGPAPDFSMTVAPQNTVIVDGGFQQTTITVYSLNYYQGLLNLSCKGLPANVSCVFSPAALSVAPYTITSSSGPVPVPVQGTLTINTSSAALVGSLHHDSNNVYTAAITGWVSLLFGVILAWRRKRLARYTAIWTIAIAVVLLGAGVSLTACGGSSKSSTSSGLAAPGTSTIQVVATDSNGGPSHTLDLVVTIH